MNIKKIDLFSITKKLTKEYYKTLDIREVELEFLETGLLNQNQKIKKSNIKNIMVYGLELSPDTIGYIINDQGIKNLCNSSGLCKLSCIYFSGVANVLNNKTIKNKTELTPVLKKRARRTFLFLKNPKAFYKILENELKILSLKAELNNKKLAIRLNVFSDADFTEIIKKFPGIQFYDYSKVKSRIIDNNLKNYHITYSVNESTSDDDVKLMLKFTNVSIVFKNKLPDYYLDVPVIDGDKHDLTFLPELNNTIIGLKNKSTLLGKIETAFMR